MLGVSGGLVEDWCERYEEARVTGGYILEVCVETVIVMGILRE